MCRERLLRQKKRMESLSGRRLIRSINCVMNVLFVVDVFADLSWCVEMGSISSTLPWPWGIRVLALLKSLSGHMTPLSKSPRAERNGSKFWESSLFSFLAKQKMRRWITLPGLHAKYDARALGQLARIRLETAESLAVAPCEVLKCCSSNPFWSLQISLCKD